MAADGLLDRVRVAKALGEANARLTKVQRADGDQSGIAVAADPGVLEPGRADRLSERPKGREALTHPAFKDVELRKLQVRPQDGVFALDGSRADLARFQLNCPRRGDPAVVELDEREEVESAHLKDVALEARRRRLDLVEEATHLVPSIGHALALAS